MTSGGNTNAETLIEHSIEIQTACTDKGGELVFAYYCSLSTESIFKLAEMSDGKVKTRLHDSADNIQAGHDSYVTEMKWIFDANETHLLMNITKVLIKGEFLENHSKLDRIN